MLKMYDQRYGGVMERLEQIKQDKGDGKMSKPEGFCAAGKDEAAKEQILSILFDDKEGAKRLAPTHRKPAEQVPAAPPHPQAAGRAGRDSHKGEARLLQSTPAVPPRSCGQAERRPEPTNAAGEPEAAPMEEPAAEPTSATAMPLAEEFEAVQPDRQGLKLLNAAIKALDKLDAYADGSNRIKPEEQTAIHDASVQLQGLRVREYVELVDWEAYEEAQ